MMAGMLEDVSPVTGIPLATRHGVLNVCKPAGWTSHDVVARVRRLLQVRKVGHAGTLDPDATGVLPILVGQGTRLSSVLVEWDKEYEAVLCLGQETTTQDATGAVTRECPTQGLSDETVRAVMDDCQGEQWQVPPMYSAVKVSGQPLYKAARKGKTIDRQARAVVIYRLEITKLALPSVTFLVRCSKGTYIRTLCAEIGQRLGVGGHLSHLTRVRVGPLRLDRSVSLDDIVHGQDLMRHGDAFLSLDDAVAHLPAVVVSADMAEKVCHGVPLSEAVVWSDTCRDNTHSTLIRVKDEKGRLLALGQWVPSPGHAPPPSFLRTQESRGVGGLHGQALFTPGASPTGSGSPVRQLQMVKVFGGHS